ncbi:MAG: pathogenicity-like protein [Rhodanobacteraceae bacterium]|nr:pathogenicity-like protein [Xanthomonadales bacterium]MCP5477719.1 pathogenicity-like protein [Rhodanobacteraceae bacterium]HPF73482.1 pathogenicity-like protein [Xanthomonadaceae bacterium]HRY00936.1 pathogenicity-like protein [Xanthomonadaceae bacterium]
MRQVFSSPRLENVEGVATMLREAGIEVYISDGRNYKDGHRRNFSYRDDKRSRPDPALWIVKAEDQPKAREILREAGLLASTRPGQTDAVQDIPVFANRDTPHKGLRPTRVLLYMALIVAFAVTVLRQCSG